jgi:hypothetical protein
MVRILQHAVRALPGYPWLWLTAMLLKFFEFDELIRRQPVSRSTWDREMPPCTGQRR